MLTSTPDITFSPDGKWLANGSTDHTVRIRSLPDLEEVHFIKTKGWGVNVAFSSDGRLLAYSDSDGELAIVETGSWSLLAKTKSLAGFLDNTLVFTNDGRSLISAHNDSTIQVWSTSDLSCLAKLNGHVKPVQALQIHPDGQALVSVSQDATVRLWHLPTRRSVGVLESFQDTPVDCDFSADGNQLAVTTEDRENNVSCHIWSLLPERSGTQSEGK